MTRWLLSTIGKRGYIADYLRRADPDAFVIGTGCDEFTPGFAHCDQSVLVPPISDPGYLEAVVELVSRLEVDAMLTLADPDAAALSQIRHVLTDAGVRCFFPPKDVAEAAFDKVRTFEWGIELGIPVPRTMLDWDQAIETFAGTFVAKPRNGSASRALHFVTPGVDRTVLEPDVEFIFQELVTGTEVNVEICGDLEGRPVGVAAWRKLRSRHGETELAVTFRSDQVVDFALRLGRAFRLVGPCDVDLMMDTSGAITLIEINTRFGGGYPTSDLAGAAFPELLAEMAQGHAPALRTDYEDGVFMMKSLQPFGGTLDDRRRILRLAVDE